MGLKFKSQVDGREVNWNLTFGYDNAYLGKVGGVRDVTYAYLSAVNPNVPVEDKDNYVLAQYEGTVIRRPTEDFNKESARIYAILTVLEKAHVTSHEDKADFFLAYREAKRNSGKPVVTGNDSDIYVE